MFNKGDKVKVVSCEKPTYWYADQIGKTYTLCKYKYSFGWDAEGNEGQYLKECDIELVKEEKEEVKFDMNKEPWFIRVKNEQEYELVQNWLLENYGTKCIAEYSREFKYLTNTTCDGYVNKSWVMHGNGDKPNRQEIKVTFKTIIDSVTFPEVKKEQQKQIEELEKTILLAKQQIETLKKGE